METTEWFAIAGVCFAGAATPGASLAVVVKNTVEGGRGQGIKCALAHGLGVGIYALMAVLGFSAILETMPTLVSSIELGGALFFLWLGSAAPVLTRRLDDVEEAKGCHYLKLDVQGGELSILEHAQELSCRAYGGSVCTLLQGSASVCHELEQP